MKWIYPLLGSRAMLILLLIINTAGTIYGYIWYKWQLVDTPAIFLPFVPDSPTASLFFMFVLIAFLMGKNWPLMEALAIVTLIKYGIWAVVMNLLVFEVTGELDPVALMLIFSHGAMAVQGVLYAPFYRFKIWHLVITGIWTLHNDVIDYVFFMLPRYPILNLYTPQIGYFTFWLSIFSLGTAYYFVLRKNRFSLDILK
ncbi:lipoprotein heptaprenylglyceryl N-acetyltransferase LhaT [Cytobacillus firmus]